MKIAIVGAGAMGCLFAGKLAAAGNEVLLVDHDSKTVSAIQSRGVRIWEGRSQRKFQVPTRKSPGDLRSYDLILVMVKAYSTKSVAQELRGHLNEHSVVVTLQNGLGNADALSRRLGNRVLAGSTTEASLRLGPGEIKHTGRGTTLVGELDGSTSRRVVKVVRSLQKAGFGSHVTDEIQKVVWSKAILNSAINPVTALTRLRNGKVNQLRELRELMLGIIEEGVKVGRADGVKLSLGYLSGTLSKVLKSTGQNSSSMLQDVMNSRKTEVRELNGVIVKLGRSHGIDAPLNSQILGLVLGLETSYDAS